MSGSVSHLNYNGLDMKIFVLKKARDNIDQGISIT